MSAPASSVVRLRGDGLDLTADMFGPETGQPVLFFHGGGQSRRAWAGVARKLGDAGYRACSVDLRGHGDSDWAVDGDYLLDAYARDAEHLIDGFKQPVILVGASRGGQCALVAASKRVERVRLLVLADVAPHIHDAGIDDIRGFFLASAKGFSNVHEAADTLARHLKRHFGQRRHEDDSPLRKTLREGPDRRLYWKWDPESVSPDFLHPPSDCLALEVAAAQLKMPVLLVRGELSTVVTVESVAKFRELTPQLEIEVALGAGHMFTGDQNDAFGQTLLDRLARL